MDEISLAEDSVLERINSVLEPERMLLLAEKSVDSESVDEIKAHPKFRIVATMNPGGDYGKKEVRSHFYFLLPTSTACVVCVCLKQMIFIAL